ncbi:DUF3306 domain-containing protein [Halomonas sp. SpR8]|uniref:DUF3306 domain-containing protein n=1 Tax=Halomonas sp. SpR8 TaxID=3050463 RepID=UPI0027E49560|nr:DUF3306 domain-containing protein [Halomonas sp. SpR8]MDQ7728992.1 DUF3306 domain-containing protein [Halomonas sp. SpR8]
MSRLERWSRIKRNVAKDEDAPPAPLPARAPVDEASQEPNSALHNKAGRSQSASEEPEAPEPNHAPDPEPGSLDHTLPDPDTLEAGSDFSAFMAPGVSGPLRRQALKRLWATGNYNARDGLDDYDADYHQLLKPMGSELASTLRRWTHKIEEAVDNSLDDETESSKQVATDQQVAQQAVASEEEPSSPCADKDNTVKNAALDDQSDYLSGTKTKT